MLSIRLKGAAGRTRTGAAGITTPNARRYTTATAGTAGLEPAASRLTSERSGRLSYAPVKSRGWDSNPRSRAHEAREDNRSSTAHSLAGRTRTCDPRLPGPVGWPAPPQPDDERRDVRGIDGDAGGRPGSTSSPSPSRDRSQPLTARSTSTSLITKQARRQAGGRRGTRTPKARRPTRFRDGIRADGSPSEKWPRQASNLHHPG